MIFLFFGSSLACLEPELELFEVCEIITTAVVNVMWVMQSRSSSPKLSQLTHMEVMRQDDKCPFFGSNQQ